MSTISKLRPSVARSLPAAAILSSALMGTAVHAQAAPVNEVFDFDGTVTSSAGMYSSIPTGTAVSGTYVIHYGASPQVISGTIGSAGAWDSVTEGGPLYGTAEPATLVFASTLASPITYSTAAIGTGPDMGVWSEVDAFQQCNPTCSFFYVAGEVHYVTGTGTSGVNGTTAGFASYSQLTLTGPVQDWDGNGFPLFAAATGASGFISLNDAADQLNFTITSMTLQDAPTATPSVTGTQGAGTGCGVTTCLSGWYISPTTLNWIVTGSPAPAKSGCGKVTVPNTTGTTYTCTVTNKAGSAGGSVTIERDAVAPTVSSLTAPKNGATYKLNSTVTSTFGCSDAGLSGLAPGTCIATNVFAAVSGYANPCGAPAPATCTVAGITSGSAIDTATPGVHQFSIAATNNAGNTIMKDVSYNVELQTPTPVFSPKGGKFHTPPNVSINDANGSAVIYYTLDGTQPTTSSPVYGGTAIAINSTTTLKSMAIAPGDLPSTVRTSIYTID